MRLKNLKGQKLSCWNPGAKQGGLPFLFSSGVSWALPNVCTTREADSVSTALQVTMASESGLPARLAIPHSLQVL